MAMPSFEVNTRTLGLVIIGISIVMFLIVYFMTQTIMQLRLELHATCPLPPEECPYKSSTPTESVLGYVFAAMIGAFGFFLTLTGKQKETTNPKQKTKITAAIKSFNSEEKKIYELIRDSDGSVFQSDLITKTGYSKVRVSRILDRLETKGIIERRRRGMANLILLKY